MCRARQTLPRRTSTKPPMTEGLRLHRALLFRWKYEFQVTCAMAAKPRRWQCLKLVLSDCCGALQR